MGEERHCFAVPFIRAHLEIQLSITTSLPMVVEASTLSHLEILYFTKEYHSLSTRRPKEVRLSSNLLQVSLHRA